MTSPCKEMSRRRLRRYIFNRPGSTTKALHQTGRINTRIIVMPARFYFFVGPLYVNGSRRGRVSSPRARAFVKRPPEKTVYYARRRLDDSPAWPMLTCPPPVWQLARGGFMRDDERDWRPRERELLTSSGRKFTVLFFVSTAKRRIAAT